MHAIISRGLYLFRPIFHWGLYFRSAYTLERPIFCFTFSNDLQRFFPSMHKNRQSLKRNKTPLFKLFVFYNQKDHNIAIKKRDASGFSLMKYKQLRVQHHFFIMIKKATAKFHFEMFVLSFFITIKNATTAYAAEWLLYQKTFLKLKIRGKSQWLSNSIFPRFF